MNRTIASIAALGIGAAAYTAAKRNDFKFSKRKMKKLMRAMR